jgi:hypothetical protein
MSVGEISPATVRGWRTGLLYGGMSRNRAAKVYRLLRAIMNTAKDDELIRKNPCRIKGADKETESSRPVASVPRVYALADAVPRRFRALVLLGAFTSLRWGEREPAAVRRRHDGWGRVRDRSACRMSRRGQPGASRYRQARLHYSSAAQPGLPHHAGHGQVRATSIPALGCAQPYAQPISSGPPAPVTRRPWFSIVR